MAIDCKDPERLARFWVEALRYAVQTAPAGHATWSEFSAAVAEDPEEAWCKIEDPEGLGPTVLFHRVPEEKSTKNRVHLDLFVTPTDKLESHHHLVDAEVDRLVGLGAAHMRTKADETDYFVILSDPEGNEFCVG